MSQDGGVRTVQSRSGVRYSSHFCLFVPLPRKQPDAGLVVSPSSDMQHLKICHLHTHVLQVLVLIMALPALDENSVRPLAWWWHLTLLFLV
ncbi:hypothetical protein AV530_016704 [Patagioenas fasciata monilis]|uniref:Uncharacterized protein n=1 Tax=Patagioenas fasciata monilis TaxID=372326 RepID=A0A1V4J397_PATFA|nr:hypothetical protein AV530_016704 [Patagioenas fasciata monilis]